MSDEPQEPMDPTPEPTAREQLEMRVLSVLLGEADEAEQAAVKELLSLDPELKAYQAQMQKTLGLAGEAAQSLWPAGADGLPRLTGERRKELAKLWEEPDTEPATGEEAPQKDNIIRPKFMDRVHPMLPVGLAASLAILLGGVWFPKFLEEGEADRVAMSAQMPAVRDDSGSMAVEGEKNAPPLKDVPAYRAEIGGDGNSDESGESVPGSGVTLYYGVTDGAEDPTDWDNKVDPGKFYKSKGLDKAADGFEVEDLKLVDSLRSGLQHDRSKDLNKEAAKRAHFLEDASGKAREKAGAAPLGGGADYAERTKGDEATTAANELKPDENSRNRRSSGRPGEVSTSFAYDQDGDGIRDFSQKAKKSGDRLTTRYQESLRKNLQLESSRADKLIELGSRDVAGVITEGLLPQDSAPVPPTNSAFTLDDVTEVTAAQSAAASTPVYTSPAPSSASTSPIIPSRPAFSLPPGTPPPPIVDSPSLPGFLNVGGSPPAPEPEPDPAAPAPVNTPAPPQPETSPVPKYASAATGTPVAKQSEAYKRPQSPLPPQPTGELPKKRALKKETTTLTSPIAANEPRAPKLRPIPTPPTIPLPAVVTAAPAAPAGGPTAPAEYQVLSEASESIPVEVLPGREALGLGNAAIGGKAWASSKSQSQNSVPGRDQIALGSHLLTTTGGIAPDTQPTPPPAQPAAPKAPARPKPKVSRKPAPASDPVPMPKKPPTSILTDNTSLAPAPFGNEEAVKDSSILTTKSELQKLHREHSELAQTYEFRAGNTKGGFDDGRGWADKPTPYAKPDLEVQRSLTISKNNWEAKEVPGDKRLGDKDFDRTFTPPQGNTIVSDFVTSGLSIQTESGAHRQLAEKESKTENLERDSRLNLKGATVLSHGNSSELEKKVAQLETPEDIKLNLPETPEEEDEEEAAEPALLDDAEASDDLVTKTISGKDLDAPLAPNQIKSGETIELFALEDENLNGLYEVEADGKLTIPGVGKADVRGRTVEDAEKTIALLIQHNKGLKSEILLERPNVAKEEEKPPNDTNDLATPVPVELPEPKPEVITADNAFSTFSLNVTDASFRLCQASLLNGQLPPPHVVRAEEFINAFDYRDPAPTNGKALAFAWNRARHPFAHNRDLIRFSIQTAAEGRQGGQPLNLVLAIDNSGSMERADRVAILKEALKVLAAQLHPQDKVSVIAFARTPRLWMDGQAGQAAAQKLATYDALVPEGGTNIEAALTLAYETAGKHFIAKGNNRVILLTDGAANLGEVVPASLRRRVESQRRQGIALDCFGIGWDGYNDHLMEALARNGDGRYAFLNSPEDVERDFAKKLAGALKLAAADVKVQVEFNPKRVKTHRQVGYLRHQLKKEGFRNNSVDAAEIGAAETGNAIYVVQTLPRGSGPIGTVHVRYREPATGEYKETSWPLPYRKSVPALDRASPAMKLAASAATFAEWLGRSPYAGDVELHKLQQWLTGLEKEFPAHSPVRELQQMIRTAGMGR